MVAAPVGYLGDMLPARCIQSLINAVELHLLQLVSGSHFLPLSQSHNSFTTAAQLGSLERCVSPYSAHVVSQ